MRIWTFIKFLLVMGAPVLGTPLFYKSERGGDVLALLGHEYLYLTHLKDGRKSWRCRQYGLV